MDEGKKRADAGSRDRELFDRIASGYGRKDRAPSSRLARENLMHRMVAPVLDKLGGRAFVLEIGCGVGAPATYLRGRYRRYLGLDQSDELIQEARRFNQGIPGVEFRSVDVTRLEPLEEPPDLVLARGVLHHIPDVDRVMAALVGIARPEGTFIAVEPQAANPVIQLARRVRMRVDPAYSREQHFFSRQELSELMERHGFTRWKLRPWSYLSKPFEEVALPLQPVARPLAALAVRLDVGLERLLPTVLQRLAWDLVIQAEFPSGD